MNKTQFKNNFGKYFQQIIDAQIVSISTNRIDTLIVHTKKNNRNTIIKLQSHIQMCEEGILSFSFHCEKLSDSIPLDTILKDNQTITEINLYEAKDEFCKEQAIEFCFDNKEYIYILIYTDMVESSLEFFEEKLTAEKFKKVAF